MMREEAFNILTATRSIPDSDAQLSTDSHNNNNGQQMQLQQQQHEFAVVAVDTFGSWLDEVDELVTHLEQEDTSNLGSAVLRKCQEIADTIGELTNHLNDQSEEERNQLAQACIQDFRTALTSPDDLELLQSNDSEYHIEFRNDAIMPLDDLRDQQQQLLNLQPNEIEHALHAAKSLLKDVEDAFRSIDRNDAEELADVAVTLARLFLLSLQSVQYQLEGMIMNGNERSSTQIEILEETSHPPTTNRSTKTSQRKRKQLQRIRILWPPLGPHVASACQWGKEVAVQKPLLTAALGLTLWPAALGTIVVGGSIVVADSVLQNIYNHFEHSQGPLVKQLECGAAQAWQTARLSLVTGKLVTKQSVRVLQLQVDRQGGWPQVGQNVAGMALDRACHPIETAGMAWNAAAWSAGVVSETFQQMIQHDHEEESAAQRLHQ